MGHLEDHATLAFAFLGCIVASGAAYMSIKNQSSSTTAPPSTSATSPPATTTTTDKSKTKEKKDEDEDSSSDSDDEKDSSKDDKAAIIDGAYKLIHQRYNRKEYKWEEFDPTKDAKTHEGVIFIVYHRHMELNAVRPLERLVEVHSENLIAVLRGCLKHIDTVFDPKPLIDAQKLFNHEGQLKIERAKLLYQVRLAEEKEAKAKEEEKKDSPESNSTGTRLFLPALGSADSDATAVNTPDRSVTPKSETETNSSAVSSDDNELTADVLRLRMEHLDKLLKFLETEFAPTRQKLTDLLVNGDIKFGLLWCLFRLGSVISFRDYESGLLMAGEITSADYMRRGDQQEYFEIHVRYIDYNGEIPFFKDLRKIRSLSAQPLDPELKEQLKSRGADFVKLKGTHYLEYHDSVYQRRNFGLESRILKFRAIGRAMVDCSSYQKMNPMSYLPDADEEDKIDEVTEDDLHFCAPTVFGYSFVTKMWGRLVADKFAPIIWNKSAFEHLVLPETTKTLIKSLVDADRAGAEVIKDVISGKGGGCIVILHGRPGTGKTLTAEAIAEERQKPLMVISVGELGKDAAELETKLTDILEISKLWEAVLLLDEADVFLEARSLHELHRNAMVGVFLRLLEYHQRVMFLTTNRVTTLDEAFKSRISIAIKYRDLDKDARRQVWQNFLALAGVKIIDGITNGIDESTPTITKTEVNKLASKKLNGREIKNTTRTAQALALSLKQPLGYDLLKQVLDVGEQFDKDFKEIDTSGMYDAKGEGLKDHHNLYQ